MVGMQDDSSTGPVDRWESTSGGTELRPASGKQVAAAQTVRTQTALSHSSRGILNLQAKFTASMGFTGNGHQYQSHPQQSMEGTEYVQQYQDHFQQDTEVTKLVQQLSHAQATISALESEREQLEENLREIQAQAFKRFDTPGWIPQCNDDVSRKLNNLEATLKTWSKKHGISSMRAIEKISTPVLHADEAGVLDGFGEPTDDVPLMGVPDDKAWILIQAFFTHQLYQDVFDEPFFGLDHLTNAQEAPMSFDRGLHLLYDEFMDCELKCLPLTLPR